jgi:hypothetical protein
MVNAKLGIPLVVLWGTSDAAFTTVVKVGPLTVTTAEGARYSRWSGTNRTNPGMRIVAASDPVAQSRLLRTRVELVRTHVDAALARGRTMSDPRELFVMVGGYLARQVVAVEMILNGQPPPGPEMDGLQ